VVSGALAEAEGRARPNPPNESALSPFAWREDSKMNDRKQSDEAPVRGDRKACETGGKHKVDRDLARGEGGSIQVPAKPDDLAKDD
jgi:hypothetical protein